ncbi:MULTISPECIES: putative bifunctional diguanylate cyclase/phosphodiesterase [Thiorhodovibrio]|uniref:putative bifunctional diguanylate cyclase/phosphodiesterase n=1 Tax=Thiorhodovibrio TaxID=61593 RepID=UPI001913ACE2|nr:MULTISPECIES: EAL domain-containing protein [Thiorhodovibrio]MBK5969160.1 hypothetical protein [Thiorhodovibrio winogradskyi]WPL13368.1 Bacteriophytochrome cph2 [Thiorhodovibrio litoralis]
MTNQNPKQTKARILAVDDDPVTRLLISNVLEKHFDVSTASSGKEALSLFEQSTPDMVLLDVIMEGMDGFAVCTALRAHPKGQRLPVVMLTSQDDLASIARAYEVGATDFIAKPINTALIAYRVSYLLRAYDTLKALGLRERQLAAAQRIAQLGHWEFRRTQGCFLFSESARELLKLPAQPQGHRLPRLLDAVHPEDRGQVAQCLLGLPSLRNTAGLPIQFEHRLSADARVVRQTAEYSSDAEGWLGTVQDVTAEHHAAQRIIKLAYYDDTTGLPNRDFFVECLQHRLDHSSDLDRLHILVIEMDAMKRVGVGWGQAVTAPLVRHLTQRLLGELDLQPPRAPLKAPRGQSDHQPLMLARISDSAFGLLVGGSAEETPALARRLLDELSQPLEVAGIGLSIKAKAGMADARTSDLDADTLLNHALAAAATYQESAGTRLYQPDIGSNERSRLTLEARLRRGIDHQELELWYQPKVDGRSGALVGAEALVRWRDPSEGLIQPGRFIPLAEDSGLIVPLTNRVLDIACADLALMHAPGLNPVTISVNISAAQLDDVRLPQEIAARLARAGLTPGDLELEITERALMSRVDSVLGTLSALHEQGIGLSLDDFGTGYSSLGYLGRFPLDILKIDRSFVMELGTGGASETVARAIVSLAEGLGLKVIAEGIETQEQALWLCGNGCDWHQGYFYARPLEREVFLRLLDTTSPPNWSALPCPPKSPSPTAC